MMISHNLHSATHEVSKQDGKFPLALSSNILTAWLVFAALGLWIYHEIAEKEFTAILTLSVMAQALSFMLLQIQISTSKSTAGISGKTMILHLVKLLCRLSTTLWLDGYLPTDSSGDWMYQVGDIVSCLMVLQIIFCIRVTHKASYREDEDSFDVRNLIMVAIVLAVLVHPDLNAWAPFDILWTVHLYIDAMCMLPQLWMISKAGGRVSGFTAHYLSSTLLANFLSGLFWFHAVPELAEDNSSLNVAGLAINGAHAVQIFLLLDVGFFYAKECLQGKCCTPVINLSQGAINV